MSIWATAKTIGAYFMSLTGSCDRNAKTFSIAVRPEDLYKKSRVWAGDIAKMGNNNTRRFVMPAVLRAQ